MGTTPDNLWTIITMIGGILGVTWVTIRSFKVPSNAAAPASISTNVSKPSTGIEPKASTDEWKKIADIIHAGIEADRLEAIELKIMHFSSYDPRIIKLEADVQQLKDNYKMLIEAALKRGA